MNYTQKLSRYTLTIGWLYPNLMSTYGDRGNIICLQKRCEWRGINVEIERLDLGFKISDLKKCDLLFMGGAQDIQQKIVSQDFSKQKTKALKNMVESGIPGLYICGAYQFLGKYYKESNGNVINGLGILDLYTENPRKDQRLIGNIAIKSQILNTKYLIHNTDILVGFENHGGRTFLGKDVMPLGKVIRGFGNNGIDKTEGTVYKNTFGCYLHGPILPKNPHFADYLLDIALKRKYNNEVCLADLPPLDDSLEWQAHKMIANSLGISV